MFEDNPAPGGPGASYLTTAARTLQYYGPSLAAVAVVVAPGVVSLGRPFNLIIQRLPAKGSAPHSAGHRHARQEAGDGPIRGQSLDLGLRLHDDPVAIDRRHERLHVVGH